MTDDWFRRRTWSSQDEAEFRARLARSRGSRSEYLRIQAYTLAAAADRAVAPAAVDLARQYLRENPNGIFQAQAFLSIATASSTMGDADAAVRAYRDAIEAERRCPNVRVIAYLEFAWFVAVRTMVELFDEALELMESAFDPQDLLLPFHEYRYYGALALIASAQGDRELAETTARRAMEAARVERGPFRDHPGVGVVRVEDDVAHQRLRKLAG